MDISQQKDDLKWGFVQQVRKWILMGVKRQKARECLSSNLYREAYREPTRQERLARNPCWSWVPESAVYLMRHGAVDREVVPSD